MSTLDPAYAAIQDKIIGRNDPVPIGNIDRGDFQKNCLFGSATSAYQFEGAWNEDGKGPSVWDSWTQLHPDKIHDGTTGNVAVDQYHLYKDDVQLMKKTGLESYRFSISWPRVLPGGKLDAGVNKAGIKYYNDLIDELIANGIEPCVTLFHWDLPLALELAYKGFMSRDIVQDFVDYAELCFWEFGDRVKTWITFNEGWTYCYFGYVTGEFPPGRGNTKEHQIDRYEHCAYKGGGVRTTCSEGDSSTEPYIAAHNMLLAHAYAVKSYREKFQVNQGGRIGITNCTHFLEPLNDTIDDRNACIRGIDWMFGWFTAPVTTGDYPPNMRTTVGCRLPTFTSDEIPIVKNSYDFIGINYYTTWYAKLDRKQPWEPDTYLTDRGITTSYVDKYGIPIGPATGADWLYVVPRGLYNILVYAKEIYGVKLIYITENGCADRMNPALTTSQAKDDPLRVTYFKGHLLYLHRAIKEAGINVKRYFMWSLGDNFEWGKGYTYRFGSFYIDFVNGQLTRTPKTSAIWWRNFFNKPSNVALLKDSQKRDAVDENGHDSRKRTRSNKD